MKNHDATVEGDDEGISKQKNTANPDGRCRSCQEEAKIDDTVPSDLSLNRILPPELVIGKNGGKKNDKFKIRMELLPWAEIKDVAEVMTKGAELYGDNNWKDVEPERYKGALQRHYTAVEEGEEIDNQWGLHHYAHMACNALFLLYIYKNMKRKF